MYRCSSTVKNGEPITIIQRRGREFAWEKMDVLYLLNERYVNYQSGIISGVLGKMAITDRKRSDRI